MVHPAVKRIGTLDQRLPTMTIAELEDELRFWKKHLTTLRGLAHKGAMKDVHKIERAMELRRRNEG